MKHYISLSAACSIMAANGFEESEIIAYIKENHDKNGGYIEAGTIPTKKEEAKNEV
jgi:hypothetical protein